MEDITMNYEQQDIDATKSLAWLSYLGILFLIPLLVNKDSAYTKFHVNQGLLLFIADVAIGVIAGIGGILAVIPFIGWLLALLISLASGAAGIAVFVFMIMGIVNSLQGKAKKLPVIGNFEIIK